MTAPRKPGVVLPVAVTLTLRLGLYVGAYYATVRPRMVHTMFGNLLIPCHVLRPGGMWDLWSYRIFSPIHWLDRRIRPHIWDPKP